MCIFKSKKYPLFSFETLKANYRFRKEIKKFNPDVILYIGVFWFFILRWFLFGLKNKAKTIVWEHGNFHFLVGKRHFLKIYARKTAAAKADRLVVLTHLDKQFYESNCYCKNTPIVISNFVRDEFLKNISAQKKVTERKKQILFAGRMANVKQVDKLINIWHKINQKRSREEWVLLLIGDGPERQNLERYVEMKKIKNVKFLGHILSPHAIFKESQILVLTSAFEGLPLVLIEGLFFSLPEVSFDCPCGPADIIDDGQNGFLIPCFDEDLFAEKLLQLMEDDSLRERFSLRTKEKSSSFLPENIMPLWDHLLKSLE